MEKLLRVSTTSLIGFLFCLQLPYITSLVLFVSDNERFIDFIPFPVLYVGFLGLFFYLVLIKSFSLIRLTALCLMPWIGLIVWFLCIGLLGILIPFIDLESIDHILIALFWGLLVVLSITILRMKVK